MKKLLGLSALVVAMCASPSSAATIVFDNSTPQSTTALTGFSTSGDQMDGMTFLVGYSAGGSDNAVWGTTGAGCGAVVGTGWSVSECGDTFSNSWTLSATSLISTIFVDAGAGDAVFDMTDPSFGTDGSAQGLTFFTTSPLGITVTFSGPVGLGAALPVGDLYRYMSIVFDAPFSGDLIFDQDMDNLSISGDIDVRAVPEPATMLLLGAGLAGAAARRRRARRA